MMQSIAKNDEHRGAVDRDQRFADLKGYEHGGVHWRVQRDVNPAAIYAHYEKTRVRRGWAIPIITPPSGVSWGGLMLLAIEAFSFGWLTTTPCQSGDRAWPL